ncbi:MAG: efflux RND transporter periplasmic adaptor subunit [Rubrivivax sp.]
MITALRHRAAWAALFSWALAACSGGGSAEAPLAAASASAASSAQAAAGPASAASAPPVSVSVVVAQQRDFPVTVRATGTVAPLASIDVKAQVSSIVTKVHVKEGQFVRAGEPLFTLDARTDEANLGKAQAQLARDQATLADAKRQLERSRDLLARNFVSQGAVDTAQANVEAQQAAVQADLAAIEAVKVSLSYARITAPSAGRVGAISVFPGTSVSPTGPALVTITQLDPISVAFNLPQRHVNDALRLLAAGGGANVTAVLPEGKGQRQGRLQFVDSQIDAASGTVKVKAGFENRDHALWPGAYADVVLTVQTLSQAIVIPQAALVTGQRGNVVFVIGPDNRASLRPVSVLQSAGADAVVDGLKAGERVAVDGRQNLRPGAAVVVRDGSGAGRPARGASAPGRGGSAPGAARSPA